MPAVSFKKSISLFVFASLGLVGLTLFAQADEGITIKSDKQIYAQDQNLMRAIGHAVIQQGQMTASSPEAIIMMGANGQASKVIFIKGAHLDQGDKTMDAERIIINTADGSIFAENNVTSNIKTIGDDGKPTIVQVKSQRQDYDDKAGKLYANGNVVLKYEDYNAKGPKAVFHTKNNAVEKIVISGGRSMVEDNDRKVTGDSVVITTNPKRFDVDGNVNTQFKSKQSQANNMAAPSSTSSAVATGKSGKKGAKAVKVTKVSTKAQYKALQKQMVDEEKRLTEILNGSAGN